MKSYEIRNLFLAFFEKNGHTNVISSSLIPKGDPTLLFTNAGMVQFKGVFLNEETRDYKRAVSCQKCMRAGGKHNDLENVGHTARHHTFFEMLGNFSFGDYFKEEAIAYAWEFLTKDMGLPRDRLWATVFRDDDEAASIWKKTGIAGERIVRLGEKDNFWSMGDTGPCGPCSEIVIDQGKGTGCGKPSCSVGCGCDRFLELWNLVFMQYNRDIGGELVRLAKPCIDTGMGLERLSAIMQGKNSNYESDIFAPLIETIEAIAKVRYGKNGEKDVSIKAVADHARAITFLISDGVLPSNEGRGYVLRRILRRAARHGRFLGIREPFIHKVADKVIAGMGEVYPEIERAKDLVLKATRGEEERFFETLERGLAVLDEEVSALKAKKQAIIPGSVAFKLYDTYGFPSDLTANIVSRQGLGVDEEGFERLMEEQREKGRRDRKGAAYFIGAQPNLYKKTEFVGYHMDAVSSRIAEIIKDGKSVDNASKGDEVKIITDETAFYGESGGQAGDTGIMTGKGFSITVIDTKKPAENQTVHIAKVTEGSLKAGDAVELVPDLETRQRTARNHTATHLLHAALRKLIGPHVRQAGSLVSPDALRFDFTNFGPLKREELKAIEKAVNRAVLDNIEVKTEVLPYEQALEKGALAFFGEKYGDLVRLVVVPGVSAELCGGTHVRRTGDIGLIKVLAESSVAAGVRRIEAVTGEKALEVIAGAEESLRDAAEALKSPPLEVPSRIKKLLERQRELEKEIERLKGGGKKNAAAGLAAGVKNVTGVRVLAAMVAATDTKEMREMADDLRAELKSCVIVFGSHQDGKAVLLAAVTKDLTNRFKAGEIIKRLAPIVGGKGGGKEDLAQAGGPDASKLNEAVEAAYKTIQEIASGV
ncbi:MAG: alanine--tRNA ligase [Deltaproteobacteria bacterium]|nr:alanine--tRNA ligase [Deltaproteobacteria bacterium]